MGWVITGLFWALVFMCVLVGAEAFDRPSTENSEIASLAYARADVSETAKSVDAPALPQSPAESGHAFGSGDAEPARLLLFGTVLMIIAAGMRHSRRAASLPDGGDG
jgi:hypothetical protein